MKNSVRNKVKNKLKYNDELEIKTLRDRVLVELPNVGEKWVNLNIRIDPEKDLKNVELKPKTNYDEDIMSLDLFSDLPISRRTLEGLKASDYYQMTLIQRHTIPHSLQGRDIIGQARTGSGKTLAYLVPTLENIYRKNCCSLDGLLALILAPTRELASQIFDVIRDIGKYHSTLSAGCIIGGKDIKPEATRINLLNILVATPGRLIQHMDESPLWDANNLIILVIDEVDRMLDMGFLNDIKIILEGIPGPSRGRQTMVFSATIESFGITSLVNNNKLFQIGNVEKISLDNVTITPKLINQLYIEVSIHEKMDTLFNFLRTHSNKKIIVFVSCCKQVRFLATVFTKLKIGCKVLELYGKQSLQKRLQIAHQFYTHQANHNEKQEIICPKNSFRKKGYNLGSKTGIVLFCTDIASRGLDFPKVDWVVQLDIPENVDTYIHRIGRTARYISKGKSLLFLMPNEKYFLEGIQNKGIDSLKKVIPNQREMRYTIHSTLQSLCASDPSIKEMAEKAFSAYIRSIFVLTPKDKRFDLKQLEFSAFALSIGLVTYPKININFDFEAENKNSKRLSKLQKFKEKLKQKKINENSSKKELHNTLSNFIFHQESIENSDFEEDCILAISGNSFENNDIPNLELINRNLALQKLRFRSDCSGKIKGHGKLDFDKKHIFFNDEDFEQLEDFREDEYLSDSEGRVRYIELVKSRLKNQSESDKKRDRDRVHEMHVKRRISFKQKRLSHSENIEDLPLKYDEVLSECSTDENNLKDLTTAALSKLGVNIGAQNNL